MPLSVTLNYLEGYSAVQGLRMEIVYICATLRTLSTDTARRAVPRRQLSFLLLLRRRVVGLSGVDER